MSKCSFVCLILSLTIFVKANNGARAIINADKVDVSPLNLKGAGVKIGIWDAGRIFQHQGFVGRLTMIDNVAVSDHATAVCGTLAGNGAGSPGGIYKGVAYESLLFSYFQTLNDDIPLKMDNAVTNQGINISNNSWEHPYVPQYGDIFGLYDDDSRQYDNIVRNRNLNIVFAAGNLRDDGIDPIVERGGV